MNDAYPQQWGGRGHGDGGRGGRRGAARGAGRELRAMLDTSDDAMLNDHPRMRVHSERNPPGSALLGMGYDEAAATMIASDGGGGGGAAKCFGSTCRMRVIDVIIDSRVRDRTHHPRANAFSVHVPRRPGGGTLARISLSAALIPPAAEHAYCVVCVRGVNGIVMQPNEARGTFPETALAAVPLDQPPLPSRWWYNLPRAGGDQGRWWTSATFTPQTNTFDRFDITLLAADGTPYPMADESDPPPPLPPTVPILANNAVLHFELVTHLESGQAEQDVDGECCA